MMECRSGRSGARSSAGGCHCDLWYGTPASFAAKQATTTIPIVMISICDPVRVGLAAEKYTGSDELARIIHGGVDFWEVSGD